MASLQNVLVFTVSMPIISHINYRRGNKFRNADRVHRSIYQLNLNMNLNMNTLDNTVLIPSEICKNKNHWSIFTIYSLLDAELNPLHVVFTRSKYSSNDKLIQPFILGCNLGLNKQPWRCYRSSCRHACCPLLAICASLRKHCALGQLKVIVAGSYSANGQRQRPLNWLAS